MSPLFHLIANVHISKSNCSVRVVYPQCFSSLNLLLEMQKFEPFHSLITGARKKKFLIQVQPSNFSFTHVSYSDFNKKKIILSDWTDSSSHLQQYNEDQCSVLKLVPEKVLLWASRIVWKLDIFLFVIQQEASVYLKFSLWNSPTIIPRYLAEKKIIKTYLNRLIFVVSAKCECPCLNQLQHFQFNIFVRRGFDEIGKHLTIFFRTKFIVDWWTTIFHNTFKHLVNLTNIFDCNWIEKTNNEILTSNEYRAVCGFGAVIFFLIALSATFGLCS